MSDCKFSHLSVKSNILDALAFMGYDQMTPIQAASLPNILAHRDIIAHAKTGSGKTLAFAVGILQKLEPTHNHTQALVLCPTRELSEQVCKELRKVAKHIPNVKITTLCGGSPMQAQEALLKHGVHCIVGTPGRVHDHLRKRNIDLGHVETLVFDEADRMLEMGFLEDMTEITGYTPKGRQTLLFSATFPENIQSLSNSFQKNALVVKVDTDPTSLNIEHQGFAKNSDHDFSLLTAILSHHRPESTLIFCNTKRKCQEVADYLQDQGFSARALHGDLEQRQRDEALVLFSNGSLSILVATDVAARGLDIKDLQAVINFDLAHDPQINLHRIGRTGRAGSQGFAFSLYSSFEKHRLEAIKGVKLTKNPEPGDFACSLLPKMATLRISCGRTNKLRPGDILGALTANPHFTGNNVGKITICDTHSFVAIPREHVPLGLQVLTQGTIKGRSLKVALLG